MSQASYNIGNISRSLFRAAVNFALQALGSNNAGPTEPTETYPYMWWADETSGLLKMRNAADTAWIDKGTLASLNNGFLTTTGGDLGGAINGKQATVASSATPDIFGAAGNEINYTGTATATGFANASQGGARRTLYLAGAAKFTAGANMIIPGIASGATYNGAAGDAVDVLALSTTQFYLYIRKADGTPVAGTSSNATTTTAGIVELATDSEVAAGTDPNRVPSVQSLRNGSLGNGAALTMALTSKIFSGIPDWATEINVHFSSLSTTSTSPFQIKLRRAGVTLNGSYPGGRVRLGSGSNTPVDYLAAFEFQVVAAETYVGSFTLKRWWDGSGNSVYFAEGDLVAEQNGIHCLSAGKRVVNSGAFVDGLEFTMADGTSTFDGGTVYVTWR